MPGRVLSHREIIVDILSDENPQTENFCLGVFLRCQTYFYGYLPHFS